jgi:hypothetical protein
MKSLEIAEHLPGASFTRKTFCGPKWDITKKFGTEVVCDTELYIIILYGQVIK